MLALIGLCQSNSRAATIRASRRVDPSKLQPAWGAALRAAAWLLTVWSSPGWHAASGKDVAPPNWLTGKAFSQQLEQPTNIACSHRPLGAVVRNLAQTQRVAIWLDRRVDPDRSLSLSIRDEPLQAAIRQIATQEELGSSTLEAVVYLGPALAAAKLRTLAVLRAAELKPLPPPRRKALSEARPWHWEDLTTPRALIEGLAREAHVEIRALDLIPHDLWPGRSLPALSWIDRLTLVAIQFNLTFHTAPDGKSIELVAVPDTVVTSRSYPAVALGREPVEVLAEQYPQADIRQQGDRVVVAGRVEDLEAIVAAGSARQTRGKATAPGKQVFKLTTEQPLGALIVELGKRLDVDFQFDPAELQKAGISLDQTVSVKVENASLEQLIDAVLAPAGLKGRRQGRVVRVSPDKSPGEQLDK